MKGVGTTVASIIIILILLFFLAIYLSTINTELNKRATINLKEAEILKLGNTFALTNRSLGMTWFISSAQAMFAAGGKAFLCGVDDNSRQGLLRADVLPAGYVYNYSGKDFKDVKQIRQFADAADAADVTASASEARRKKYNDFQPYVCYETDKDAVAILQQEFLPYTSIKNKFEANGISISVDDIANNFEFDVSGEAVISTTNQKLTLTSSSGSAKIEAPAENRNILFTEFPDMVEAMRRAVRYLARFSDRFYATGTNDNINEPTLRYQPLSNGPVRTIPDTSSGYVDRIKSELQNNMAATFALTSAAPPQLRDGLLGSRKNTPFSGITSVGFDDYRLFAANKDDSQVFGLDKNSVTDGFGLILYYDATITLTDSKVVSGGRTGKPAPAELKKIIEDAVAQYDWTFHDADVLTTSPTLNTMDYTNEDIFALISSLVMQESSWQIDAVSACGAAGPLQFIPSTARGIGINVPSYSPQVCDQCPNSNMPVSECNACTPDRCDRANDERFVPDIAIPKAVKYVHDLFDKYKENTPSKFELVKLVLAAWHDGEPTVDSAIRQLVSSGANNDNIRFADIRSFLTPEGQRFADDVLRYYASYGGRISEENYYYHDAATNRFYPRPFSIQMKASDYLPALSCLNETGFEIRQVPLGFVWDEPKIEVVCCGSQLWSCSQQIDALPPNQQLSNGQTANRPNDRNDPCEKALIPVDPANSGQIDLPQWNLVCGDSGFTRCDRTNDPGNAFVPECNQVATGGTGGGGGGGGIASGTCQQCATQGYSGLCTHPFNPDLSGMCVHSQEECFGDYAFVDCTRKNILFVPVFEKLEPLSPTYSEFADSVSASYSNFLNMLPSSCRNRFNARIPTVSEFDSFQKVALCPTEPSVVEYLAQQYGYDVNSFDVLVGVGSETKPRTAGFSSCLAGETRNVRDIGKGTAWYKITDYIDVFAHEMGHLFLLKDQYCSQEAGSADSRCNSAASINPLSAELGCDPTAASGPNACCGSATNLKECSEVDYGICCLGNKVGSGRSTMSFADVPHGGFDQNEIQQIRRVLNC